MPVKVVIQITQGPMRGRSFEFDSHDTFLFGRRSHCDAAIDDPYVSREHFLLEANPPYARLRDLGSLHGTHVNGQQHGGREVQQPAGHESRTVDLRDGDRISVGKTEMLVRILSPPAGQLRQVEPESREPEPPQQHRGAERYETCRPTKMPSPDEPLPAIRCDQCGKGVAAEVGEGARGAYLCVKCRQDIAEPVGIQRLMQVARQLWQRVRPEDALDAYVFGEVLGTGSMGVVYKATRKKDGLIVAVKQMLSKIAVSEQARKMFMREIDGMSRLRHAHVVELLESKSAGSQFFIVAEYCGGGSLSSFVKRNGGKLSLAAAAPLMLQTLEGLAAIHQAGVVHRDLKPANILLSGRQESWKAKIADLGLCKSLEHAGFSGMTVTGAAGGTPAFMPREQITNFKRATPANDVWSVAATFYYLLTGRVPLDFPPADERDWIEVVLNDEPVPIRERDQRIPSALAQVIDRALAVNPDQRYGAAHEMKRELERALSC